MLEGDKVAGVRSYTADNLKDFLTRKGDKDLMSDIVKKLKRSYITP